MITLGTHRFQRAPSSRRRSAVILLLLAFLLAPMQSALARGKGFKEVVKHIETNYRAKKVRIPMLGLANFAVKLVRPAGVKGFKLAVFEDQNFAARPETASFMTAMREAYLPEKGWHPLVQVHSKRDGGSARTFIYARMANQNKEPQFDKRGVEKIGDVEFAVAVLEETEAVVVEVKFNADAAARFLENPKILGFSLRNSIHPANPTVAANRRPQRDVSIVTVVKDDAAANTPPTNADAPKTEPRPTLKTADKPDPDESAPPVAPTTTVVEPKDPNAIRIETRLVNLNVKAMDKKGLPLTALKPEDFTVYEDDVPQEITHFKPVNAPVNVIVMMDLSGSTRKKHKSMADAAKRFIDALPKEDRVAIVAFTRKYIPLSDFTHDKAKLKLAVEKIKGISGGTAFYDSLWQALDQFGTLPDARKAVVVLTDGEDESLIADRSTSHSYEELLQRASAEDVTIYPIYYNTAEQYDKLGFIFGGSLPGTTNKHKIARKQLDALAEQTGGEVVNAAYESDLAEAYARVASELHTLYSLAYSPDKAKHNGEFRKVKVAVKHDGANARTRKGYYDK